MKPEKHGQSHTRLYLIWQDMKKRCDNKNAGFYHLYGGRGIRVCAKWLRFSNFMKWSTENGYGPNLQIDRINRDGNYSPSNCRWSTSKTQQNNRNNNRRYKNLTLMQWCEGLDLSYNTAWLRLKNNIPFSEALNIFTTRKFKKSPTLTKKQKQFVRLLNGR